MNIAKVRNSAAFVNYVKPGVEFIEMEVEGAILMFSTGPGSGNNNGGDGSKPGETIGGPEFELRSSKPRARR